MYRYIIKAVYLERPSYNLKWKVIYDSKLNYTYVTFFNDKCCK